jgi:hypothetical protein
MNIGKDAIETEEPKVTGHYVCFLHGLGVPTVIRFWCVGTGWLSHMGTKTAGTVAGWIGPLPVWPENGIRPVPLDTDDKPQEFDL